MSEKREVEERKIQVGDAVFYIWGKVGARFGKVVKVLKDWTGRRIIVEMEDGREVWYYPEELRAVVLDEDEGERELSGKND